MQRVGPKAKRLRKKGEDKRKNHKKTNLKLKKGKTERLSLVKYQFFPRNIQSLHKRINFNNEKSAEIEAESPLLTRVVTNYSDLSKRNSVGQTTVYYCQYCDVVQHTFHGRIRQHKKKCKKRKAQKQREIQQKINESSVKHILEGQTARTIIRGKSPEELQIINENRRLKEQIARLTNRKYNDSQQTIRARSDHLAQSIVMDNQNVLFQCLTKNMSSAISKAIKKGINIDQISSHIRTKLVSAVNNFSCDSLLLKSSSILEETYNEMVQHTTKNSRTERDSRVGQNFFVYFTDFDLYYQSRIIAKISKAADPRKRQIYRYYNKLKAFNSDLPDLISVDSRIPWIKIPRMLNFGQLVSSLVGKHGWNNLGLTADMWLYLCLGLRSNQLKKIRILTSEGKGAMFVRVKEGNTHKTIIRYVPKSLIQMILYSKIVLPITEERLNAVRGHFYQLSSHFQSSEHFYSLRHYHSINFIEAIHKVFGSAFFYGYRPKETFLIDETIVKELDDVYSLNFPFKQSYDQDKIMLDFISNQQLRMEDYDWEVTIDDNNTAVAGYQLDFILKSMTPQILKQIKTNKWDFKQDMLTKSVLYQRFRRQLSQAQPPGSGLHGLIETFANALNDFYFYEELCNEYDEELQRHWQRLNNIADSNEQQLLIQSQQQLRKEKLKFKFTEKQIIEIAAKFMDKTIALVYGLSIEIYLPTKTRCYIPGEAMVIAKLSNNQYQLTDQQLAQVDKVNYKQNISKIKRSIKDRQNKVRLSRLTPKCTQCKINLTLCEDITMGFCSYLKCPACCKDIKGECSSLTSFKDCSQVTIRSERKKTIGLSLKLLEKTSSKNNLKAQVEVQLGKGSYSTTTRYTEDIPSSIVTNLCCFSPKTAKIITQNRANEEYLPLEIKKSTVKEAGQGLFVTQNIPASTVILSYVGTLASTFTTKARHNSNFLIGWLHDNDTPKQLLINTETICNAGRFINSSSESNPQNCYPMIGVFGHELAVVLFSKQPIAAQSELFYDYGADYWLDNNIVEQIKQIQDEEAIIPDFDSPFSEGWDVIIHQKQRVYQDYYHQSDDVDLTKKGEIPQVPIIEISSNEFDNFEEYAISLEQKYGKFGAVKIVVKDNKRDKHAIQEAMNGKSLIIKRQQISCLTEAGVYKYENTSSQTQQFHQFWSRMYPQGTKKQSSDKEFWQLLAVDKKKKCYYSPDNQLSFFPENSIREKFFTLFNRVIKQTIVGINTPFVFVGKKDSIFGMHTEDYHLSAINFHLLGDAKVWYVLSPSDYERAKQFITKNIQKQSESCTQPHLHKQMIADPYLLSRNGFRVHKIMQNEGEIVVTFPKAYHWGFNMGNNLNEAFNFGTRSWIKEFQLFKNCQCGLVPKLDRTNLIKSLKKLREDKQLNEIDISKLIISLKANQVLEN